MHQIDRPGCTELVQESSLEELSDTDVGVPRILRLEAQRVQVAI